MLFGLNLRSEAMIKRPRTFQQDISRQLVGCTVLTRYNNRTYRIDDIDWGKTPMHTFESSSGGHQISFMDYYWYVQCVQLVITVSIQIFCVCVVQLIVFN